MKNQVIEIKNYRTLDSSDRDNALAQVDFKVQRSPLTFVGPTGSLEKTERDTIYRVDDGKVQVLGYASKDYKLVPHVQALDAMFNGLDKTGIPYQLKSLQLDRNGAKMFAQFELMKPYAITEAKGDVLNPILTGINSYDGGNSLGFDLESVRLVCMNLARCAVKDFSQRFLHTSNVNPDNLVKIAAQSMSAFENKLVPLYRELARIDVTKELAIKAVAVAVTQGAIPMNVAGFAKHCVDSDVAAKEGIKLTAWAMYNAMTWASTKRGDETSPSRARDIRNGISKLFADGGKDLLKQASLISEDKVNEVFEMSA
jgi:hypothetical protein